MKKWLQILIALVLLGIIASILIYKFVINKPHPDYASEKAAYTIEAQALYNEFKQHKETASPKYAGKVIEVRGPFSRIEEADSLVVVVFVLGEGIFGEEGVRVTMLPQHAEEVRQLSPGTQVRLKGLCTGYNDSDVVLEKGSVVN
jgi:hypothetical protein